MADLETPEFCVKLDEFGGENSYGHYAVGGRGDGSPYQWTKQVDSHWGGTSNGTKLALAQRDRHKAASATSRMSSIWAPTVLGRRVSMRRR